MSPWCGHSALPVALALGAAFLFAVGVQLTRFGLRHTDTRTAALIQIATATALYWLAAPLFVEAAYWLMPVVGLFAAIGLFRPFLSAQLALAGTRILGPTVSATVGSTAPLFGVALGVLVLDERLTPQIALGTAGVVAGVAVLSGRGRGEARRDWPLWALALPVGAALIRSVAQLLAKVGMESLPSPFFVGLVGYTVSFLIALADTRRDRASRGPLLGPGTPWLVATGVCYGFAILSLNTALGCGRMVVVSPLLAVTPLFSLLLGWRVFGEERLGGRVVAGVALVVAGVALIGLRG